MDTLGWIGWLLECAQRLLRPAVHAVMPGHCSIGTAAERLETPARRGTSCGCWPAARQPLRRCGQPRPRSDFVPSGSFIRGVVLGGAAMLLNANLAVRCGLQRTLRP
jgi:hypothetical protein